MKFDMDAFRAALRSLREDSIGGRKKLADETGLAPSTIQSAELGPDVPGIDTVARIISGCGQTLSSFFARIEHAHASDVIEHSKVTTKALRTSVGNVTNPLPPKDEAVTHVDLVPSSDSALAATVQLELARAFIDLGTRLTMPARSATQESDRSVSSAHAKKSDRRRRRA